MLGCELTKLDDDTLSLITNADVMRLLQHSAGAHQVMRDDRQCIWKTHDTEEDACYIAMFNFADEPAVLRFEHECCHGGSGRGPLKKPCIELWTGKKYDTLEDALKEPTDAHGARLYKVIN